MPLFSCGLFNKNEESANDSYLKIVSPQAGSTINGMSTIEIEIDENKIQIEEVYGFIKFCIDGEELTDKLICSNKSYYTFNTTAYKDGKHTIEIKSHFESPDIYPNNDRIEVDIDNQTSIYPEPEIIELNTKLLAGDGSNEDRFGSKIVISGDGSTIAVGAPYNDEIAENSGAVYIFTKSGNSWIQEAKLLHSDREKDDLFGSTLSINEDGSTVAIGIFREDFSCFIYIFEKGTTWQNGSLNQTTKLVVPNVADTYLTSSDTIVGLSNPDISLSPDNLVIIFNIKCEYYVVNASPFDTDKTDVFFVFEKGSAWVNGDNNLSYPISYSKGDTAISKSGDEITTAIRWDGVIPWAYEHLLPNCNFNYNYGLE